VKLRELRRDDFEALANVEEAYRRGAKVALYGRARRRLHRAGLLEVKDDRRPTVVRVQKERRLRIGGHDPSFSPWRSKLTGSLLCVLTLTGQVVLWRGDGIGWRRARRIPRAELRPPEPRGGPADAVR
jgi:hypothetical protein